MIQPHMTPDFLVMALDQFGHAAREEANRSPKTVANICFGVKYMLTAFVNVETRQRLAKVAREAGFTVTGDGYGEVIQVHWGVSQARAEGWAER